MGKEVDMTILTDDIVSVEKLSAEIILEKGYSKVLIVEDDEFLRSLLKGRCAIESESEITSPELIVAYGGDDVITRAKVLGEKLGLNVVLCPSSLCMSAFIPYYYSSEPYPVFTRASKVLLADDILASTRESVREGFAVAAGLLMEAFDSCFQDGACDRDAESAAKLSAFDRYCAGLASIRSCDREAYSTIKDAILGLLPYVSASSENLAYKLHILNGREDKSDLFACAFALYSAYVNYEPKTIFFSTDRVKVLDKCEKYYSSPYLYAECLNAEDYLREKYVADIVAAETKKNLLPFEKLAHVYRRLYGSGGYELREMSLEKILSLLPVVAETGMDRTFLKILYLRSYLDAFNVF